MSVERAFVCALTSNGVAWEGFNPYGDTLPDREGFAFLGYGSSIPAAWEDAKRKLDGHVPLTLTELADALQRQP